MQKELVVFFAMLAVAFAAIAIGRPDPKPDKYKNEEGCYINQLDELIPEGQFRATSNDCKKYSCVKESQIVEVVSCGSVSAKPPLRVVQDLSKQYPDCCPRVIEEGKAGNTHKV